MVVLRFTFRCDSIEPLTPRTCVRVICNDNKFEVTKFDRKTNILTIDKHNLLEKYNVNNNKKKHALRPRKTIVLYSFDVYEENNIFKRLMFFITPRHCKYYTVDNRRYGCTLNVFSRMPNINNTFYKLNMSGEILK